MTLETGCVPISNPFFHHPGKGKKLKRVHVLHGINLDKLGQRQPEIYGQRTLKQIDEKIKRVGRDLGLTVVSFQTNDETEYARKINELSDKTDFLILNPGRWTHESKALRSALSACKVPAVEVHLSNVYAREPFRHLSVISDIVIGRVMGLGLQGYVAALRFAADYERE